MRISVIISALNEEEHIGRTLGSLEKQCFRDFEVILVDGGSTDRTVEIAEGFDCKVIRAERKGISYQCNLGAKSSSSQILAFTQADTILPVDWLEKISLVFLHNPELIAVTGPLVVHPESQAWLRVEYKLWNLLRLVYSLLPMPFGMFFTSGPNIAVRKEVFEKIGGFDEFMMVHEDGSLGKKLMGVGKVRFCGPMYLPIVVRVSSRRAEEGILAFHRHYLYMLAELFPFKFLLPQRVFESLRKKTWVEMLAARGIDIRQREKE